MARRWTLWLLLTAVLGLGLAIYARALNYPLIFDDLVSVKNNPSIRQLWPLTVPLRPPDDSPLSVRPLVNLPLAVNHAIHQARPAGYRAFDLALHLITALLIFGVIRRCAVLVLKRETPSLSTDLFAAAVALLWLAHPLNTEAVVYITQRTELMVSFFYVLTLYAALRGFQRLQSRPRAAWFLLSILACVAGMASKEIMVSAPLFVLLLDRTLIAGSFRKALARSPWLYLGLAATWSVLVYLLLTQTRGQTAGLELGVTPIQNLQTQAGVILWYLRLAFWPSRLSVAHDWPIQTSLIAALPAGLTILAFLAATIWLLWRRSWVGLAGAWFFLILAPTSSIIPIVTEVSAERRMYLPLLALIVLIVYAAHRVLSRIKLPVISWMSAAVVLTALAFVSVARVGNYVSVTSLWTDAVEKFPFSATAAHNLAGALFDEGKYDRALAAVGRAIVLDRTNWTSPTLRGQILAGMKRDADALASFQESLTIKPKQFEGHNQFGRFHASRGQMEEAAAQFRLALAANGKYAEAHNSLGVALYYLYRRQVAATQPDALLDEAIRCYRTAIALDPDYAEAYHNLGTVLAEKNDLAAAVEQYRQALRIKPALAEARFDSAKALARMDRLDEAIAEFQALLRLQPQNARAHNLLGILLARSGKLSEAISHFRTALDIQPDYEDARRNLARAMAEKNPK